MAKIFFDYHKIVTVIFVIIMCQNCGNSTNRITIRVFTDSILDCDLYDSHVIVDSVYNKGNIDLKKGDIILLIDDRGNKIKKLLKEKRVSVIHGYLKNKSHSESDDWGCVGSKMFIKNE